MDGAMTKEHDALQEDLPDYAGGRLATARASDIERHLTGCPACRDLVDELRDLRESFRDAGDALFEPHPEPAALRRFASGGAGAEESRIGKHAALCVTCRLEIDACRQRAARPLPAGVTRSTQRRARGAWLRLALAVAAGLAAGVLVTMPSRTPRRDLARGAVTPNVPASSTSGAADPSIAIGQTVLHLLPDALRDGAPVARRWVLDPDEPYLALAFPVLVPASVADEEVYRIEIRRAGAGVCWSTEMTAARLREHMDAADAVHLPAVPIRLLPQGEYDLVVRATRDPGAAPIFKATVEIAYRQSPAATKAPQ